MWLPLMAAIAGIVTLTDAVGGVHPASGVGLTLTCAATNVSETAVSDENGMFRFTDVEPCACSIVTDLQGFAAVMASTTVHAGKTAVVTVPLDTTPTVSGLAVTSGASMAAHRKRSQRTHAPTTRNVAR